MTNHQKSLRNSLDLEKYIRENLRCEYVPHIIKDIIDDPHKVDPCPYYQRNYIWDTLKSSFFIESLLKNNEVPPLIFFSRQGKHEIIDGRQRFETIIRFLNNKFKLNGRGLTALKHLAGKTFADLTVEQQKNLMNFTLRIYIYEFHGVVPDQEEVETQLKREIFARYNTGVTPLTQLEIFKAKYINDSLTIHFQKELETNKKLLDLIALTFGLKSSKIQPILNKIRQLLVLHYMPIHSYSYRRAGINNIYDFYSRLTMENNGWENILSNFKTKLSYLQDIRQLLPISSAALTSGGQIFECIFWALSICNKEKLPSEKLNSPDFKKMLARHIHKHHALLQSEATHKVELYNNRFTNIASFFSLNTNIDFDPYLEATPQSRAEHSTIINKATKAANDLTENHDQHLKKDPITKRVSTIIDSIQSHDIIIRPPYQRDDVISRTKSSAIIESLLLGFRLPPIFLYTRSDKRSEVIDGQQRILSLLAFLGESYTDENGKKTFSKRNNFKLNLNKNILKNLHNRKHKDLPENLKQKIRDTLIQIVEIKEDNNPNFDPVDLFMRLNFKPYPIKKNTFESWNSLVDRRITDRIKRINEENNGWFYYSRKNERMTNEELITCLVFLQYKLSSVKCTLENIRKFVVMHTLDSRLHLRIYNKNEITDILTDPNLTDDILSACNQFENEFMRKIRLLLPSSTITELSDQLDELLFSKSEGKSRTNLRFYILWIVLSNIPMDLIESNSIYIKSEITQMFNKIIKVKHVEQFEALIKSIWKVNNLVYN